MFIDRIKIKVEAGKGGAGCVSFRREKGVPRGGPNGGDGGDGGDVILEVDDKCKSLSHLWGISQFKGANGQHGKGKEMHGKDGKNLIIKIPPGTLVYKTQPTPNPQSLLADLISPGESIVVANGGAGGRGNTRFKTSTNRAPRTRELGNSGEEVTLLLELKLIADIGLVGYPNAGKSTLLAQISNARPKIASYPFTTLTPNLGILKLQIGGRLSLASTLTVADIPGIIEGAHKGRGLGLEFLRHIERTNLLIFVLDITQDPVSNHNALINEIRKYNPRILKKPSLIVLNKIDLVGAIHVGAKQKSRYYGKLPLHLKDAIPISALKGNGIDKLISAIQEHLTKDYV